MTHEWQRAVIGAALGHTRACASCIAIPVAGLPSRDALPGALGGVVFSEQAARINAMVQTNADLRLAVRIELDIGGSPSSRGRVHKTQNAFCPVPLVVEVG